MSWLQLQLNTNRDHAETLSELLQQFGAISVSLTSASDDPIFATSAPNLKLWEQTQIKALLHPDMDLDVMLVCLRNRVGTENILSSKLELVQDKDWVHEIQTQHQPIIFPGGVAIVPSWCADPEMDIPAITLDPGMAFGTGSHATTALCIEWLLEHDPTDSVVIDYGCGSGILAMVAAISGARQVYAVDIDPQAVTVADRNIKLNNLDDKIRVGHVNDMDLPQADILLANILMNPLQELAQTFSSLVAKSGNITLSGILHTQAQDCLASYARYFTMDAPIFRSEWSRLHGIRN